MTTEYDSSTVSGELTEWSLRRDLAHVHVAFDAAPSELTRDWLRALHDAGTRVTWSGDVPATAIAVEPVADPRGAARISVASPAGRAVVVGDAVGQIDSVMAVRGGATVRVPSAVGSVYARIGDTRASTAARGSRDTRGIVVLGSAGWDAKFVAAALEEQGWRVAVRLRVAPGLFVGSVPAFDTARVSAVIALDSTAAGSAQALAAYVRSGGGLILGAGAARRPAFAAIAPGRVGASVRSATTFAAAIAPVTRLTLAHAPLIGLRADAVVLEQRRDTVLAAARRLDAGRVLQIGYDETWRWRMAGGDESPDAHRAWWAQLVEAVAYAPVVPDSTAPPGEPAPRAALVAALGDVSNAPTVASSGTRFDPSRSIWVYIAVALLLLAEWASRRLRGAK